MRRTEWRRLRAESGFWNTICSARKLLSRALLVALGQQRPVEGRACPLVAGTMPSSVRASVVFPLPDSPTSPSVSPGQIAALTSVERVDVVTASA